MTRTKRLVIGSAFLPAAVLCASAGAQGCDPGSNVPHQFVVHLRHLDSLQELCEEHHAQVLASYLPHRLFLLQSLTDDDDAEDNELHGDSRLDFSERDRVLTTLAGTTQSFFVSVAPIDYPAQPATNVINLVGAQSTARGAGTTVAVLDTGVSPHSEFTLIPGFNFIDGNTTTLDIPAGLDRNGNGTSDELVGHGTMIAGLVALVAPQSQILPVKVLDSDGSGTTFTVAAGIYFAADQQANVINLSLCSPVQSSILDDAVAFARSAGCVVVAAVGNDGSGTPRYPAACPGVLAVGAVDDSGQLLSFSNYGPYLSLTAPGESIVSTYPDDQYKSASGTSFASAWVSGAAALVASTGINTSAGISAALTGSAVNIDPLNPTFAGLLGYGMLDANGALPHQPACGSADFNGDGDQGTDADIDAFFACIAGSCCPTCGSADFNGDGDLATDADIEAFFRVLAGGSC